MNRRNATILAAAAVLILMPLAGIAQEAGSTPEGQPGLKIAPTRYEERVAPGKAKDGVIDIFNVSKHPLTVQADVENIRMVGENGDLEFYTGDNPYRLHTFVQIDKSPFTLDVGEARRVKFRLDVPAGVFPGGYFGSILFRIVPPAGNLNETTVLQSGEVGTLLILDVEGDSARIGKIEQFSLTQNTVGDQKAFKVAYRNTGSESERPLGVAYRPAGTLVIKNMLGITAAKREVKGELILPGSTRAFETKVQKPFWFGRYTAEVQLSPGTGQSQDKRRTAFWSFSPVALGLVGLVIVLGLGWLLLKRLRHRHRPATQRTSLLDEVASQESRPDDYPKQ